MASGFLISTVPSYLALGDFGFSTAAANDMTAKVARGDRSGAVSDFQSVFVLTILVFVVGLLLIFIGEVAIPNELFGTYESVSKHTIRLTLAVMAVYGLISVQGYIFQGGFRSTGHYALGTSLTALTALIEGCAVAATVLSGFDLTGVAIGLVSVRLISLPTQAIILRGAAPWLRLGLRSASLVAMRRLWAPAVAVMAIPLAQAIVFQGTTLAVGLASSPEAAATFAAVRTLTRIPIQVISLLNHAVMPEFTKASALGQTDYRDKFIQVTVLVSLAVVIPSSLLLSLLGQKFVEVWTRGNITPNESQIYVMTCVMLTNCVWHPLSNLLLANDRQATYSFLYLTTATTMAVCAFPLAVIMGPTGGAVSMLCVDVIMARHIGVIISREFLGNIGLLKLIRSTDLREFWERATSLVR